MMLYNNKFRFLITTFSHRQCVMFKPQKSNFVECQKPVRQRRSFWHRIHRDHDEGCLPVSGVKAKMTHFEMSNYAKLPNFIVQCLRLKLPTDGMIYPAAWLTTCNSCC